MNTGTQWLAATTFALTASLTQAATIDFELDGNGNTLKSGDVIDANTFSADGIHFSTTQTIRSDSNVLAELMIFDSNKVSGGDGDLLTPANQNLKDKDPNAGQGNTIKRDNILIISEDNISRNPDDHANGGTIFIDFDVLYRVTSLGLLDIEDTNTFVKLFDDAGNMLQQQFTAGLGDNSFEELIFNQNDVASIEISLSTSGALTHFNFEANPVVQPPAPEPEPVPPGPVAASEPGALALMALGMIGLVSARRRQQRS